MIRKIIQIDEEKCNGCGLCAHACHEGAIAMEDGKARLMRDDYCDGLGDCLPACPAGAISFVTREAAAYDKEAVLANQKKAAKETDACKCPGSRPQKLKPSGCPNPDASLSGCLSQWPIQIKLVPETAPYFEQADLFVAADCTAYAYGNFHDTFIKNHITLIGCPKLDAADYSQKLAAILSKNSIKSITCTRMEVPCCGGMEQAVKQAVKISGKQIPVTVHVIQTDGSLL